MRMFADIEELYLSGVSGIELSPIEPPDPGDTGETCHRELRIRSGEKCLTISLEAFHEAVLGIREQ